MADLRLGDRVVFKDTKTTKAITGKVSDVTIRSDTGTAYTVILDNGTSCICKKEELIKIK